MHRLADRFAAEFGFTDVLRDDFGEIYNAADPATGDALSFDCSYNTVELSLGIKASLDDLSDALTKYVSMIQDFLNANGHMLTGLGINPGYKVNRVEPVLHGQGRKIPELQTCSAG